MHILCLGLNHTTANVELRECLAYTPYRLEAGLARLGCGTDVNWNNIKELVIISTCNRVELYAAATSPIFETLQAYLSETQDCPVSEFSGALYRLQDQDAIRHLFEVAAGLDSVVVGEPQILGQVTDAYAAARRHGTAGKLLSRLFQSAIHAGKRARSETGISHNPASIASIAVNIIAGKVPDLAEAKVLVLGAGEMAELAVESLRKRGTKSIWVINRTLQHAQELADRWDGRADALERLPDHLPEMDVVITSTGAPHIVVRQAMVEEAMAGRAGRPLVIMDIAVPRDVEAQVKDVDGVHLYDMDTLSQRLEISLAQREAEIPKVEAILSQEQVAFQEYLAALDVIPIIVELRSQVDSIRQEEVSKAMRRMPDLTPQMEQQIDALTKAIVNKILHSPTARLREEAGGLNAADYASIARGLFGLD